MNATPWAGTIMPAAAPAIGSAPSLGEQKFNPKQLLFHFQPNEQKKSSRRQRNELSL